MDLSDIWPSWHSGLQDAAGSWLPHVAELLDENGGTPCKFCDNTVVLDKDFDLYTVFNCQVVCLSCADAHVPQLTAWVREYRRLREQRDAVVTFHHAKDIGAPQ